MNRTMKQAMKIVAAILFMVAPVSAQELFHYENHLLNQEGKPVSLAIVTVCETTGTSAPCVPVTQIYADSNLTPKINPFKTDSLGNYDFWVYSRNYLVCTSGAGTQTRCSIVTPSSGKIPNTVMAFSSTPTFQAGSNASYSMTLSANITAMTISGTPVNGNILRFQFIQDSSGSHTVTFPGSFSLPTTFAFKSAPNQTNRLTFLYDGTNWQMLEDIPDGALDYYVTAFSATPVFANSRSAAFDFTLTSNVTASTFSTTGRAGTIFNLDACENSTGGFTFAFPSNVTNPPGFTFDTVATHCNYLTYRYNGTSWTPISTGGSGGGGSPGGVAGDLQCAGGGFVACGENDNGSRLTVDRDVNFKGPNPYFDLMRYGGYFEPSNAPVTSVCSITASSTTLSCVSNSSFLNGHGVVIPKAGLLPLTRNASFPAAPTVGTVTPIGVSNGSTTYSYQFVLEDYFGGLTAAGTAGSTTTGAATLGVNTVSLTGMTRVSGLDTFTCATNCNLKTNAQVQITGFTGGGNSLVNGTVVVNSLPDATHFTVLSNGMPDYSESASGTLSSKACNELFPSGLLTQESVILRTWIYRGGTLVGVSPGQDPFFVDCGQGVSGQPAYVPSSAPGAAQAGYLATTVSSGGGTTTMTLAASAGTTATSQTVQHDNSSALLSAFTAAVATHGGVIRISVIQAGGFNTFPFNATTDLTTVTNVTDSRVRIEMASVSLNQPFVPSGTIELIGIPQTSTSFSYSPLGSIGGSAHPLMLANNRTSGAVTIRGLKFVAAFTGQSSLVIDENISGGGEVGFILNANAFSGKFASAVVVKGGFDFWFNWGTCNMSDVAAWASHPCIYLTNASTYLASTATQVPGRVYFENLNFSGGTAVQVDNAPMSNQLGTFTSGGGNILFNTILHESNAGPTLRVALGLSTSQGFGYGYTLNDVSIADNPSGTHQPILELTGSTNVNGITMENNRGAGGTPTILGGDIKASPLCINNVFTLGCGSTPNQNINGVNSINDGGVLGAVNGGSIGYLMSTPAAPASCIVSAGGAVPITVGLTYAIAATDRDPVSTNPYQGLTLLGPNCTVTTTSGQQTVTVTRPTLPAGATGWMVWRQGALASMPIACSKPLPATTTTFVDTLSFGCGQSAPISNTAFTSGINSTGTTSANAFMSGWALGQKTITSGITLGKNDATTFANTNAGSFAITLNHALGQNWIVYNLSTGANTLTIQPDSGTLDGASSTTIANGNAKMFTCDGVNCQTLGSTSGAAGNIANALQYATPYYSAAGTANNIAGVAPSTTNGLYVTTHNVTGAAAVPPSDALLGVPVNVQTTNYTLLYSDRASFLIFQSCTTPTLTLPAIAGNLASNMPFRVLNLCSGNLTITATAPNTIDGGSAGGSVTVKPGWTFFLTQDATPNWFTVELPDLRAFATSCTAITFSATSGLICATLPTVSGVNAQTTNYTAIAGDNGKIVSMNGTSVTLTLPASPPAAPWGIFVENVNATSLTVSRNGLNIDGAATNLTLTQNQGVWITHDGSNYFTSRGVGGAGGGSGGRWDQNTNPSANLLLSMGTNLSEWDYTTALANAWGIKNVTPATVTVPQSSPEVKICGTDWTGAGASTEGCLKFQYVPAVGLNAQATVKYSLITSSTNTNPAHIFNGKVYTDAATGSFNVNTQGNRNAVMDQSGFEAGSGTRGFYFSNTANIDGGGPDSGITRVRAGTTGVSNGSAGNVSGLLELTGVQLIEAAAPTTIASTGTVYEDSTQHEYFGATNGASTFGMMNRTEPGAINNSAQTAAITTATLCAASAGACNVAGQYRVHFDFIEDGTACGTPGTGGVTFLLTWTDANGTTHSAVSLGMDDASAINTVSQTFHFQTTLAAAWASGDFNLSSNGSVIQYATGYTACGVGTGSYRLQAAVSRIQ